MPASISRLVPIVGSLDDALVAFRSAELRRCLSQLHGVHTPAGSSLRARAFLRLGEAGKALSAVTDVTADSSRERGEIALLRAVALVRLGRRDEASEQLREARIFSISSLDRSLEAEVWYYDAVSSFSDGDTDSARASCLSGLEEAEAANPFGSSSDGFVPLEHVVSRLEELLGVVAASTGDYRRHLTHARRALAALDACPTPDVFQRATALKNLAILTRDFDLENEFRMLAEGVPHFAWTQEVRPVQFATIGALGWCHALRGDAVGALRCLRKASEIASEDADRIFVAVDRSLIGRAFGHSAMVIEELEYALDLSERCDWESTRGDSRLVLLPLAQAASAVTPSRARETLTRYTSIRNAIDYNFAARLEARVRAEEAYTHGLVLRAEGRPSASMERLRVAFQLWSDIGYEWRAARAALELAELAAGDMYTMAVRRELTCRPNSIFASRARLVA